MSSFSCNAGTSIEKKTCDCGTQTAVSLELDTNPLITKSSRLVDSFTVELASPNEVKERESTGDSLSHSRVSLGTDAVEARKNSIACERRGESPSLNVHHDEWTVNQLPKSPGSTKIDLETASIISFLCDVETTETKPSRSKSSSFVSNISTGMENSKLVPKGGCGINT